GGTAREGHARMDAAIERGAGRLRLHARDVHVRIHRSTSARARQLLHDLEEAARWHVESRVRHRPPGVTYVPPSLRYIVRRSMPGMRAARDTFPPVDSSTRLM